MKKNKTHYRERVRFTLKMKKDYTILIPEMAPLHFRLIEPILSRQGFKIALMGAEGPEVLQKGLKYVHNDICYPALLITGQMLSAMESGKYDPDKVAMVITQSGGGCRDSNYIHLMRKAFEKAGYPNVPFISANIWGLEFNSGINLTPRTLLMALAGMIYGDMIMIVSNQVRPYEVNPGDTDAMIDRWIVRLTASFQKGRGFMPKAIERNLQGIGADFAAIPVKRIPKVRVAVIGELFLKYSPPGNNHLEEFLAEQDCEVFMPSMLGFGVYKTNGALEDLRLYGGKPLKKLVMEIVMGFLFKVEDLLIRNIESFDCFTAPERVNTLKKRAEGVIGIGNSMGEGWYLAAEMLELAEHGYENIVCVQPFGCLPCHVSIKGMMNKVRRIDSRVNAVDIEYDPGATRVNQENRIKLMLAVARENLS
ncbi:MAG: 2-hydroxyacyl-CoA dehydratase [Bacteroides sp.]|nr:2-hydroxyacyl-CoA dehydratase [Bacteroides sp.]MCM1548771.1 2-hydroxyacyl-CoA dehydratase [Clostridium sp.]